MSQNGKSSPIFRAEHSKKNVKPPPPRLDPCFRTSETQKKRISAAKVFVSYAEFTTLFTIIHFFEKNTKSKDRIPEVSTFTPQSLIFCSCFAQKMFPHGSMKHRCHDAMLHVQEKSAMLEPSSSISFFNGYYSCCGGIGHPLRKINLKPSGKLI